jgi:hypothetical protein
MTLIAQNTEPESNIVRSILRDEGIQRSLAGVFVAFIVAGARKLIFRV